MAKHASDTSSMELSHYATVLKRRWKLVALGLAAGIAGACALVIVTPSTATSTTMVKVNVISSSLFNNSRPASDLLDMQTEQAMARSTQVMTSVAEELGEPWTRPSVRQATTAVLLPDSTVLRIEFTASTPAQAAEGATLVAEQYLKFRSDVAQDQVDGASEPLKNRVDSLKKQLGEANRKIAGETPGSAAQVAAELEADEVKAELATVTSQLNELGGVSTSGGEVLTEADPEQVATSPNRKLLLVSGALGGLLLGLVGAFVVNVLDRRVRDSYDVAGAGGGDVVARLRGAASVPVEGEDADELRALRERLLSATDAARPVLAVIDVARRDAIPSDVAVGLALALADSGAATDLVLAAYPPETVELIASGLQMHEVDTYGRGRRFRGGIAESLSLVVPGSSRSRLSTSDLLAELLDDEVRAAEATVVALGPSAGSSVCLTAGRSAHQCVLVAHELATTIDDLAEVATDLQAVWGVVHGTVLVDEDRRLSTAPSTGAAGATPTSGARVPVGERTSGRQGRRERRAAAAAASSVATDLEPLVDPAPPAPEPVRAPITEVVVTPERDPFDDPSAYEPETPRAEVTPPSASAPSETQGPTRDESGKDTAVVTSVVQADPASESTTDDATDDDAATDADAEHPAGSDADASEDDLDAAGAADEVGEEPVDEDTAGTSDANSDASPAASPDATSDDSAEDRVEDRAEASVEDSAEDSADDSVEEGEPTEGTDDESSEDAWPAPAEQPADPGDEPLPWAFKR